ncbi:MAG TPA: DeoR/GlpR family DNA-binding transcription regulator [Ideonella sp.]|uniref:DeoR/GlpR family DNA-binding transcription regulator n=1 Tax=Ideonella sp. TaxID=1929293 RepID=UPI002BB90BD7|nr:DeoR/GlpR family DNA-binding transcription regulator [Ideonella sp.]HSI48564.1 DeoR/GlpR family DNA-binding transcription regulator [Ideonella sp.]
MDRKTSASPQFSEERRARILEELQAKGRVEVPGLARLLEVSEHTIRRDLLDLQAQGKLHKTHGGAVTLDTARLDFAARSSVQVSAKLAIGQLAATLIEPGQTVIIDAGSTSLSLARALVARPLTIITNALDVAALFDRDPQVQLVLTGGSWQPQSRALWGPAACEMLARCRADWAVPGACAVDLRMGTTVTDEADAATKQAMIAAATRTLILADHTKLDKVSPFGVAQWHQVHTLVSDRPWPELAALGVQVLVTPAD